MDYSRLRDLYIRDGEFKFANMMIELINSNKLPINEFSLKGLYEALGRPSLANERRVGNKLTEAELKENVVPSAFPQITGALINKIIQEAYQMYMAVGDELVTVIPSSQQDDTIVGVTSIDQLTEVQAGANYEEGAFAEKYHKIRNRKFGKIISLTEEMIRFDQTGQMIMRARNIGENARAKKEQIIMDAILEVYATGAYASWRPQGSAVTLYSNTSTDPFTTATQDTLITDALVDESDIDAAFAEFASMTDEDSNNINVNPTHLLTGLSKASIGEKIVGSQGSTIATYSSGVIGPYKARFKAVASSYVDTKKGANYWLIGDFKKQFVYTEVFPLETFQAKPGATAEFDRDEVYRFKARLMGGCGAITNRYVIMSTGAG